MQDQDRIYGSQLVTQEERTEYRRMRSAKTAQEREQIRAEHHEQMKERASAHGMTLPDEPLEQDENGRCFTQAARHKTGEPVQQIEGLSQRCIERAIPTQFSLDVPQSCRAADGIYL